MTDGHRENGRHDAVTARAILRLSHGVSQLSASNNPNAVHRGLFRCKHSKKGRKCDEQNVASSFPKSQRCVFRDEQQCQMECDRDHVTGSKRKWYSDSGRNRQHAKMDFEHSIPPHRYIVFHSQHRSLVPTSLPEPPPVLLDEDNLMLTDFTNNSSSSCSSVLTRLSSSSTVNLPVTFTSDEEQSTASCEHEADVDERVEDESQRRLFDRGAAKCSGQHRRIKQTQPWSSLKISQSSNHVGQTSRSRRKLNYPSSGGSNTTIAGDSSDGLSVKLKIPRLSSVPTSLLATTSSMSARRSRCKDGGNGRKCRHCETSASNFAWQSHGSAKDTDWRHHSSNHYHKDGSRSSLCAHKSRNTPLGRYATFTRESSTSSSSPSPRNASQDCFETGHRTSDSGEDLANDEQSDFPADEHPPHLPHLGNRASSSRTCLHILHPQSQGRCVSANTARLPSSSTKCNRNRRISELPGPIPVAKRLFPQLASDQQQMDSELEEIMDGTWPLLSNRAKAAYLQGVSGAGLRRTSDKASTPGSQSAAFLPKYPSPSSIQFVPSVLGPVVASAPNGLPVAQTSSSKGRYIPAPPWEREDMDEDPPFDSSEPNSSVSAQDSTRLGSGKTHRPTVDSWSPPVAICPPLPETNVGHQMLQKLGWTPGVGLGLQSQGILTPVGCSIPSKRNFEQMGIEKQ